MLVNEVLKSLQSVALKILSILLALNLFENCIMAQGYHSPSDQLDMIQINGYRYPSPSLGNLLWLALVPNESFLEEVALFDFMDFEVNKNYCPYFTSGRKLPSAEYSITKCDKGEVCISWKMDETRISRESICALLRKELNHYRGIEDNNNTTSYKIRYGKWYVYLELKMWNGVEKIKLRASTDPY